MIIVCQKCKTRFSLNDNEVNSSNFIARCSVCGFVFSSYKPTRVEEISFVDLEAAKNDQNNHNVISISNQKGGVAKTTTCLNLGLSLALFGKKVLVIDFDVQSNLTTCLGGGGQEKSFYDLLADDAAPITEYIVQTKYPNLDLLPSNKNMVLLNKKYFGAKYFEFILKDRLRSVTAAYDFILIDTPPSIEFFTLNALTTSKMVIIPCQCDYLAVHGVEQILKLIQLIKAKANPDIKSSMLFTMYDHESTASSLISSKLKEMYGDKVLKTVIESDSKLREAQIMNVPVIHYSRKSKSGQQYLALARELLLKLESEESLQG